MERISFILSVDSDGKITVKNVLEYIMQNVPQIKVPDANITRIPLADLTLTEDNTKKCVDGYTEGITWIGGRYTEYQFTLIFK